MNVVQNEWQQKEWECYKDVSTCLIGYFFPLCLHCKSANDMGESVPFYCCMACCFGPVGICLLRQRAREKYGIEGSTAMDVVCSWCCSACVICQTHSEIKHRNGMM